MSDERAPARASEDLERRPLVQSLDWSDDGQDPVVEGGSLVGTDSQGEYPVPKRWLTTKTDLRGFYSYSFAVEVFAVVSLTLFLPITLEQFARDNGRLLPDLTDPCTVSVEGTPLPSPADLALTPSICAVRLFGRWVDTSSFSLFVYSASVACQALVVVTMGDAADDPRNRRKLLLAFAAAGSLATMMFFFLSSSNPIWPAASLLATVGNVGFGASVVCLNSFLPTLARGLPKVVEAAEAVAVLSPSSPAHAAADAQYASLLSSSTSSISAKGIALGYLSGIAALGVALVPVTMTTGSEWGLRLAIGGSGVWWAAFTIPAAIWLPRSPSHGYKMKGDGPFSAIESWKSLGRMLRAYRELSNTFWFLLAWFLLSDAFTTITSTAVLFAKTTLAMPASSLILIGILTPLSGIIGAMCWPRLQHSSYFPYLNPETPGVGAKGNLRMLGVLVGAAWLVPAYGCIGFWWGTGGLKTAGEMYFFAIYFGAVYGAFQSYARTVFASLIPPGQEAKWYALYSITDKSSSFFGPLVVGIIADRTHNIRAGFVFIAAVLFVPMPILRWAIDVDKGREDAEAFAVASTLPAAAGTELGM